ncbi:MAG: alpha/beta hydrolase [Woeseia sp.]|nr:alpha/beta hydrolase [Woeseia sp.]
MRTFFTLMAVAGAAWLVLSLYLYFMQERVVFLSHLPGRAIELTPSVIGLDYTDVYIDTSDGVRLHGWHVYARDAHGTVLFLHGNAGNISHRLDSIAIFNALGLDVLIIDYRGYGQSDGSTSEQGTYRDAEAAWHYLAEERAIDPSRIIIFGRSLGGAVATHLAATHEAGALIVESGFTSAADMAANLYPFLPVRMLLRLEYPVIDYVATAKAPVLIVHGRDDEIIPYAMGQELYEAAPRPKAFLELEGDHNSAFMLDRERYVEGLQRFLAEHVPGVD